MIPAFCEHGIPILTRTSCISTLSLCWVVVGVSRSLVRLYLASHTLGSSRVRAALNPYIYCLDTSADIGSAR
jgi:hypothetical protein